ncbi:MAG TPA: protein kinase [Drouetiella sp.]
MTERDLNEKQRVVSASDAHHGSSQYRKDELLGGRYRVLSLMGRGGMGVVYRVEQIFLGEELALKTIDQASQSEIAIRRFQAEARAVFAVNHPNIVAVHDFGLLDDQTPFLAMELVQGSTLSQIIGQRNISVNDILKIFIQICHGLAHAHKSGVVHRDVKPGNIMILDAVPIGTEGSVKILDFGIAKLTEHEGGELQALTRTGEIFGSPIYMSPEQCSGGNIDHRSDIYSLGCVMFEALTGTPPFVGESALSTMMMHQTGSIPTLKEASLGTTFATELEEVVGAMLCKNPNDRYQDLSVAAADLAKIISGQSVPLSIAAKPVAVSKSRTTSTISIKRWQYAFCIFSAALLSTLMTYLGMEMWFLNQRKPNESLPPPKSLSPKELTNEIKVQSQDSREDHVAFNKSIANKRNSFNEQAVSDKDFEAFQNYKYAQEITARGISSHDLTNKGLSYLKDSKVLLLTLQGKLGDIDDFTQLKYLKDLNLSNSTINKSALMNIARLKMLYYLNLDKVENITEDQIRQLTTSNSLRWLVLTPGAYTPELIRELHKKLPLCIIENYDVQKKEKETNGSSGEKSTKPNQDALYKDLSSKLDEVLATKPDSVAVAVYLNQLGDIRTSQNRGAESLNLLERGIRLLEKNGNEIALPQLLEDAAKVADQQNKSTLALKYANRLVELAPITMLHDKKPVYQAIQHVLEYPVKMQRWQEALNYCNAAIEMFTQCPDAIKDSFKMLFYANAGDYNVKLGNKEAALKNFRKLDELTDSDSATDFYWHASAPVRMGRCLPTDEEQKESYLKGIKMIEDAGMPDTFNLMEHYCDACVNLGAIYRKEGKLEDAIAINRKGLKATEDNMKAPKHLDAHARTQAAAYDIATMLRKLGRSQEVKAMKEKYHI